MRDEYFVRLQQSLAERGVAAAYIDRLIAELEDHCADAAADQGSGSCIATAHGWRRDRLGEESTIVSQVMMRPELRGRLSGVRARLRAFSILGAEWGEALGDTVVAGPSVMRWSASIACGSMITAALLLVMAQSVVLNV